MEYRIRFDACMDADILSEIERVARGGRKNKALLFLVRHWFELKSRPNLGNMSPESGAKCGETGRENGDDLANSLSEIDDIFS